jgi:hypothetical protein
MLQPASYITDGDALYEVINVRRGPGVMGVMTMQVIIENCRDFRRLELVPGKLRTGFRLVKEAPRAWCPDCLDQIVW